MGACAGEILTTFMFYPIELVKARLQASSSSDVGGSFAYRGLTDGLSCIAREEGIRGLFGGIRPVVIRAVVSEFAIMYFSEFLLGMYRVMAKRPASPLPATLLRMIGGFGCVLTTLPLETISTRVTTARPRITTRMAIQQLYKENGFKAFWKGLRVSFVLCLNPALMFTAVDNLHKVLLALQQRFRNDTDDKLHWALELSNGFIAKFSTMCIVYPLIRGKVLLQARDIRVGFVEVLLEVFRTEGWQSLYKGLVAQLSKSTPSSAVKYYVKERTERHLRAAFALSR